MTLHSATPTPPSEQRRMLMRRLDAIKRERELLQLELAPLISAGCWSTPRAQKLIDRLECLQVATNEVYAQMATLAPRPRSLGNGGQA